MAGVSETESSNQANADGVSTVFNFTFFVYNEDDIKVYSVLDDVLTPITIGIIKTINQDFVGGNVTFNVAPSGAVGKILIRREVSYVQDTEFSDLTRYKEKAIEEALNSIVLQVQQLAAGLARSIKYTETAGVTDPTISAPQDNFILVYNGITGRIEAGGDTTNIDILVGITDQLVALAAIDTEIVAVAGVAPEVLIVAGISASVVTVAGIAASVVTVAGISGNITTVANNIADIDTCATNIAAIIAAPAAATSAATSATQAEAANGAIKLNYNNSNSMADPGTGTFRINTSNFTTVTKIAVDALSIVSGNPDISDRIADWANVSNSNKGKLTIGRADLVSAFVTYNVTGITDNGGWLLLNVSYIDHNSTFINGSPCYFTFAQSGPSGATPPAADVTVDDSGWSEFTGADVQEALDNIDAYLAALGSGVASGALVYLSATQSIPASTNAVILFPNENYDDNTFHSTVSNTGRLTIPSGVTKVRLTAQVGFNTATATLIEAALFKNGSALTPIYPRARMTSGGSSDITVGFVSPVINVTAGDYFELIAYHNAVGSINALGSVTYFAIEVIE